MSDPIITNRQIYTTYSQTHKHRHGTQTYIHTYTLHYTTHNLPDKFFIINVPIPGHAVMSQ